MSNEKIVTLFDKLAYAQAAERNLIKAGFDEDAISLIKSDDIDPAELDGEQSFWKSLFGNTLTDEDRVIYSKAIQNNGTVLTVHVDDEQRATALAILNRQQLSNESQYQPQDQLTPNLAHAEISPEHAAALTQQQPAHTAHSDRPYLTGDETQDEILQLAKEDLEVGKRIETEGSKRIRRYVVENDVTQRINLKAQHAEVLRRNVDHAVAENNIDWSDKEISVEEYTEKPVINKNAKIVEEVLVKKVNTTHDEVIHDTVREQKVDVIDDLRPAPHQAK